jgi:hypothetical protein
MFRELAKLDKLNINALLQELPASVTIDTVLRIIDILVRPRSSDFPG